MRAADRRRYLAIRLTAAAIVWSLGLVLASLLIAAYPGQTVNDGTDGVTLTSRTLVQVHGLGALALVLVPLVVSGIVAGTLHRRRAAPVRTARVAWISVAIVAVVALLGITSLGALMLPVVALLAASAWLAHRPAGDRPAQEAAGEVC